MEHAQLREVLSMLDEVDVFEPGRTRTRREKLEAMAARWLPGSGPGIVAGLLLTVISAVDRILVWHVIVAMAFAMLAGAGLTFVKMRAPLARLEERFATMHRFATMRLTDAGVEHHWANSVTTTPWSGYRHLTLTPSYLVLLQWGGADVIPLAAFASDEEFKAFAQFAADRIVPL